jgi:hypothetical protein
MGKEKEPRKTVYRDSKDGQFVTKREAERKPSEYEKERVRTGRPPPPPPSRKR